MRYIKYFENQTPINEYVVPTNEYKEFIINGNEYMFILEGNDYVSNTFYDKEDFMLIRLIKDLKSEKILFTKKMKPVNGKTVRVAVSKDDLESFKKTL